MFGATDRAARSVEMALYTCKCLNIRLTAAEERPPQTAAPRADCEQRDPFFREHLVKCLNTDLSQDIAQPALVNVRLAGAWAVHSCGVCGTHTHATGPDTQAYITKMAEKTSEAVEAMRRSEHYSPVFKLLVPELVAEETREVPAFSQQLRAGLQTQLEAVEKDVQQYRDVKYAEYERFRERALRDHRILLSIVNKARQAETPRERMPAQESPPPLSPTALSAKSMKKVKHNYRNGRHAGSEEDSLDAEDIFDLEGDMEMPRNYIDSDADNYDSDDSGSNDEGIQVRGPGPGRAPAVDPVARSLPVNVPNMPHVPVPRRGGHDGEEEGPLDIAASIKALARSVHAESVFGDLPRPRFSTQI